MYKRIILFVLISLNLSVTGCKLINNESLPKGNIQEQLINMQSYAATAKVSKVDKDQPSTYEVKQIYQIDGMYRLELISPEHMEGLTTIFNGEKIIQYNPKIENSIPVELPPNEFRNQLFLGTFIKNYLQSEEVAIEVQKIQGDQSTVLEAIIPGGSQYMSTQRLWIDQKTYKPLRMVIYNAENIETLIIEFLEFAYNPKIDESIFTIQ